MYLERLKKLKVLKELIQKKLIQQSEFPDKAYVERLLSNIDTRYALFSYDKVAADSQFDLDKLTSDLMLIQKDLQLIYEIVDEFLREKYTKLESFVDGYLSTLEELANRSDKKAMEEIESTSLDASIIFFTNDMTAASFDGTKAIINIDSLKCTPQSKIYGSVIGTGFDVEDVVFEIGDNKLSPNSVNNSMMKVGGTLKRNTYTYAMNENYPIDGAFKIPNSSIVASERNKYEVYGGRDSIFVSSNTRKELVEDKSATSGYTEEVTTFSFYLTDATKISFEFSSEPAYKNFSNPEIKTLKRNKMYHFEFTLPAGTAYTWSYDGTAYATKENVSLNGSELYITKRTLAKDFIIYEYAPGNKVEFKNVRVVIHNVRQSAFRISSIAIKEINETGVAAV